MPNEANYLDISLLGKEYRVACPSEEREGLIAAVAYVDQQMHSITEKTKSNISERIAVMAALNIAYEYLSQKHQTPTSQLVNGTEKGVDSSALRRRILEMEATLEAVLEPQDRLI